jgi:hypothetical protein
LTVTAGKAKVGVGVMVGVSVWVGVNVIVGVKVIVKVGLGVNVKAAVAVAVLDGVEVQDEAVAEAACSGESPQAEMSTIPTVRPIRKLFFMALFYRQKSKPDSL